MEIIHLLYDALFYVCMLSEVSEWLYDIWNCACLIFGSHMSLETKFDFPYLRPTS
jgi:hypothetical protein